MPSVVARSQKTRPMNYQQAARRGLPIPQSQPLLQETRNMMVEVALFPKDRCSTPKRDHTRGQGQRNGHQKNSRPKKGGQVSMTPNFPSQPLSPITMPLPQTPGNSKSEDEGFVDESSIDPEYLHLRSQEWIFTLDLLNPDQKMIWTQLKDTYALLWDTTQFRKLSYLIRAQFMFITERYIHDVLGEHAYCLKEFLSNSKSVKILAAVALCETVAKEDRSLMRDDNYNIDSCLKYVECEGEDCTKTLFRLRAFNNELFGFTHTNFLKYFLDQLNYSAAKQSILEGLANYFMYVCLCDAEFPPMKPSTLAACAIYFTRLRMNDCEEWSTNEEKVTLLALSQLKPVIIAMDQSALKTQLVLKRSDILCNEKAEQLNEPSREILDSLPKDVNSLTNSDSLDTFPQRKYVEDCSTIEKDAARILSGIRI